MFPVQQELWIVGCWDSQFHSVKSAQLCSSARIFDIVGARLYENYVLYNLCKTYAYDIILRYSGILCILGGYK